MAKIDDAFAAVMAGRMNAAEASRHFGVPASTLRDRIGRTKRATSPAVPTATRQDANEMELAALRKQLAESQARPPVERVADYPEDVPTMEDWARYEATNARKIQRALSQGRFVAKFTDNRPIAIAFVSDQHISGGNCVDLKKMREDAQLIAATDGLYAVLGGDAIDNHIKHRSALMAARTQPDDQFRLFEFYLSLFVEKVLVLISGNHDHWTNQIAGLDILKQLAERQRVHYSPHEARIDVTLGDVTYKVAVRHQFRMNSTINQTHTVKQWYRFGDEPFDIGCVCHHHELAVEVFRAHGAYRWACRPGAYQVYSDYSHQYGYGSTEPSCPTFVIYPKERRIVGFKDMRDGVEFLKVARG